MALGHLEMAYAVHTNTCTYLLDEDGVCRWIVSQQGVVPAHVRQCIGAQFVACLDLSVHGGLIGDLRPGARALFVRSEADRMVLLRTGLIRHVDDRRAPEPAPRSRRSQRQAPAPEPPEWAPEAWAPEEWAPPERAPERAPEVTAALDLPPPEPPPRRTRVGRDSPVRHQTEWSQPVVAQLESAAHGDEPPLIVPRQYGKQAGLPYRAKPPRFGIVRRTGEEQTITVARSSRSAARREEDERSAEMLPVRDDEPTVEPLYTDAETVRQRRE